MLIAARRVWQRSTVSHHRPRSIQGRAGAVQTRQQQHVIRHLEPPAPKARSPFLAAMSAQPARCCASSSSVQLSSSLCTPSRPTTVLIHGLDSSKQTWTSVLADLQKDGYPAIAVDLRGHGESPLGNPDDFGPAALASDVLAALTHHGISSSSPVVIVGHSMGGKVAMRLAAMSPDVVAALVIEDMDTNPRRLPDVVTEQERSDEMARFRSDSGRRFESWEEAKSSLEPWYDPDRIESWKGKRIRQAPGQSWWWSDVNPLAKTLAYKTVLASNDALEAWKELSDRASSSQGLGFPVHVWVADKSKTVCSWDGIGGITAMQTSMPSVLTKEWPGADHSIHNTSREEFVAELKKIVLGTASAMSSSTA